jgi:hypothetical protein
LELFDDISEDIEVEQVRRKNSLKLIAKTRRRLEIETLKTQRTIATESYPSDSQSSYEEQGVDGVDDDTLEPIVNTINIAFFHILITIYI